MKCPHCGKEIETQQQRAARARWNGVDKKKRSAEMKKVRQAALNKENTGGEVSADQPETKRL